MAQTTSIIMHIVHVHSIVWHSTNWASCFPWYYWKCILATVNVSNSSKLNSVIHLQFWAYGSWNSLIPISMSPTANLWVQNTIFHDKSAIPLHPGTRWNKNFASWRQNYVQKMQDVQVKNHCRYWSKIMRTGQMDAILILEHIVMQLIISS